MRDASICGLGQTASSAIESALRAGLVRFDGAAAGGDRVTTQEDLDRIYREPPARPSRIPQAPPAPEIPAVEPHDRRHARSASRRASTILEAARQAGIDTPTLCYGETLTPVNVCRVCVVEVAGARVLAPACSRKVEPGMDVRTD